MLTRKPNVKDYAELGEQVGTQFIGDWMVQSADNPRLLSLITIDKKKIVASLLVEFNPNTEWLDTYLFFFPEETPNVGEYLVNKAKEEYKKNGSIPKGIGIISKFDYLDKYKAMGFGASDVMYYKNFNGIGTQIPSTSEKGERSSDK